MWRYVSNRFLTLFGNILLGTKVSEFHTGYRAYSRELLEALPLAANSNDFVFDNQVLAEAVWLGFQIGEVSCPTSYAPDASSITFLRSVPLRARLPGHGGAVPIGQVGLGQVRSFSGRQAPRLQHLAPARELSEEQQQERQARQADRHEGGSISQQHRERNEHREQHRGETSDAVEAIRQRHRD